jgi:hypothetical protein
MLACKFLPSDAWLHEYARHRHLSQYKSHHTTRNAEHCHLEPLELTQVSTQIPFSYASDLPDVHGMSANNKALLRHRWNE